MKCMVMQWIFLCLLFSSSKHNLILVIITYQLILPCPINILHCIFHYDILAHCFEFGLSYLIYILAQMLHAFHGRTLGFVVVKHPRCREHFPGHEHKFVGALEKKIEGRFELEARFKNLPAAEDVKTKTSTRKCHCQTADVTEITHGAGSRERENDIYESPKLE